MKDKTTQTNTAYLRPPFNTSFLRPYLNALDFLNFSSSSEGGTRGRETSGRPGAALLHTTPSA